MKPFPWFSVYVILMGLFLFACVLGRIYRTKWQDVGHGFGYLQSCGGAETEIKFFVD